MRPLARGLLLLSLASSPLLRADDVRACAGEAEGPVYVNTRNPDLPLGRFFDGHVGVVGPWSTAFQVLAWRALGNLPIDAEGRAAFVARERAVHRATPPLEVDPTVPVPAASEPSSFDATGEFVPDNEPWRAARAAITGSRGPEITNGWSTDGAWTPNCLTDAFRAAADALRQRAAHDGERSDAVRAWVDAQDMVFTNCGPTPGRSPLLLPDTSPVEQRRDRAYQVAAAHFYAGRYDDAERAFTAIAADAASPWSPVARYLVLRAITRSAQRGRPTPDPARLARAADRARDLLADPNAAVVHDMTRRYAGWIDTLRDPNARARALGAELDRPGAGARLVEGLHDYVQVYAHGADPGDGDPMTAWIASRDPDHPTATSRARALAFFGRGREPRWTIAVLQSPGPAGDPRLDPALEAAGSVGRDDRAFATARYERLRLLVERGRRVHGEVVRTAAQLTDDDGPTARNLFRELALRSATSVDELAPFVFGRPAGWTSESALVTPADAAHRAEDFSPLGSSVLSLRVPVGVLLRVAAHPAIPAELRARLVSVVLHRAAMLGDESVFLGAAALVPRLPEAARRPLLALAQAPAGDTRRLALLRSLVEGGGAVLVGTTMVDPRDESGDLWSQRCTRTPEATPAWFLSTAEQAAFRREQARWLALGDLTTWSAAEAARLAPRVTDAPGMAALLASSVRATHANGCPPAAPIHAASRAAFTTLHRLYPRSPEARATRYWY